MRQPSGTANNDNTETENYMDRHIETAVFDNDAAAERAVRELRAAGVPDRAISVIGRHDGADRGDLDEHHRDADDKGSGAAKGAAIGGGVGALAGLAALAIPGVGPFIAAGGLIEALGVGGSAAVASAAVGATAGGLTGALVKYGVDEEDARYYEQRVHEGGVLVAVEATRPGDIDLARRVLLESGGRTRSTAAV